MTLRDRVSDIRSVFYRPVVSRRNAIIFLSMSLIFIVAIFMRIYPAIYGWYLNEFDPYWDYYTAAHVVTLAQQHGLFYALLNNPSCNTSASAVVANQNAALSCEAQQGYFYWHTSQFWWPYGRNVAATSQDGLDLGGAFLYLLAHNVLGVPVSLYDFLVFFPVLFGSLTTISLYFLVKKITGNAAGGIFAGLIFAVSPPILERGNLGWFKSEPFSLFLSVTGSYLFLTMYDAKLSYKGLVWRAVFAGACFGGSIISWGGGDEYSLIFALVFLAVPFIKRIDLERTVYGGSLVVSTMLLISAVTPRPGISILTDYVGAGLIVAWLFAFVSFFLRKYGDPILYFRNLVKILLIFLFGGLVVLAFNLLGSVSGRYLTVVDSFLRSNNPLVQSVAEQAIPTGAQFFDDYWALILFAGLGAFMALRKRNIESLFALALGLTGIYIASSFARLMVYSTLAFGILAAIGIVEVSESILRPVSSAITKKKTRVYEARSEVKVVFAVFMIFLISLPMFVPVAYTSSGATDLTHSGWFAGANVPVSISDGGTSSLTSDWFQAFQWMRQTPANSSFVAWWDYGYWIAVMGNRTSLADNATSNSTQIALIGQVLVSSPQSSIKLLEEMHKPTYMLIFVAGEVLAESSSSGSTQIVYTLTAIGPNGVPNPAGGDESKKQWFIRIGNTTCGCLEEASGPHALMYPDDFTPTSYFWANTTMGQLVPLQEFPSGGAFQCFLSPSTYSACSSPATGYAATEPALGGSGNTNGGLSNAFTELYSYQMKMPATNASAPFQLAFESSSILAQPASGGQPFAAVLIYKINYNYVP
jgi:dolichyl-diphosphooligosaccharide---protein glycosyltransferase